MPRPPHFRNLLGMKSVAFLVLVFSLTAGCPQQPGDTIQPGTGGVHWLRLAQISDVHIIDNESPNRMVRFAAFTSSAWRPQEAYSVHVLDATLRVINERQSGKGDSTYPIDFVLVTGDLADSSQHNELRWFLDTMDGEYVTPDSGTLDGELRDQAPEDNPKLGFQTEGLDPALPWYTVYGNHDDLSVGVFGVDRHAPDAVDWSAPLLHPVAGLVGLHLIDPYLDFLLPTSKFSPAIIRGSEESMNPDSLRLDLASVRSGAIARDLDRRFTDRMTFIEEHFNTTTLPVGHGFDETNLATGRTRYSVHPKDGVPVRLVVLDTVAPNAPPKLPAHYGAMTQEQFDSFVKPEIEEARANGEFVLLASHHPSEDFDLPYPAATVRTAEWRNYVASQPNIIAHVCGHTHQNLVTLVDGPYPYYEIQTDSLIDYPQEGRFLDVFYDADTETIRLESSMFSHMDDPTHLSEESFRRAMIYAETAKQAKPDNPVDAELKAAGQAAGMAPVDAFPPLLSAEEAYGRAADRDFSVTFHRARLK